MFFQRKKLKLDEFIDNRPKDITDNTYLNSFKGAISFINFKVFGQKAKYTLNIEKKSFLLYLKLIPLLDTLFYPISVLAFLRLS